MGLLELNIAGFPIRELSTLEEKELLKDKDNLVEHQDNKDLFQTPKGLAIICHPHPLHQGTMNNKVVTTIQRSMLKLGLATVRFNFRGVGQSEGSYGEGVGEVQDLAVVVQWALQKIPEVRLYLAGFSFGAYIAARFAYETDLFIEALLSVAPAVHHFKFEELKPRCPWIIIQGDDDELVSFEQVIAWYENIKLEKKNVQLIVMPKTSHFFHGKLVALQENIVRTISHYI